MNLRASSAPILSPEQLWPWGRTLLAAALGVSLLGVLFLAWKLPEALFLTPLVILAGFGAALLCRHPLANLFVLLVGFVCIADKQAGFQIQEVLYGLCFFGYMGYWFVTRSLSHKEAIFEYPEDRMLGGLLLWTVPAFALVFVFHGDASMAFKEWEGLLMLSVYFPVREACVRYRNGTRVIMTAFFVICVFVILRNLWEYHTDLVSAIHVWQVKRERVNTNDNVLMAASVISLTLLVFAEQWRTRLTLLAFFLLAFLGLILTLSRGYWVAFAVGAMGLFLIVEKRQKRRMILFALYGAAGMILIGTVFFGDLMSTVLSGLQTRFTSIGTSTTQDPSVINRLLEAKAVWTWIATNPIMGYGLGVPYHFYDMNYDFTMVRSFMHNAYLSLWYRFGIFGLLLVLYFWATVIFRGVQAFRIRHAERLVRVCGLAAGCALLAFTVSALTSNPFVNDDHLYLLGFLAGLASGTSRRAQQQTAAVA
ncbi:MAG TPA: O-antigen ligase family protein [Rhodothermales bacterium]|nr:O-antigen ligase family protein [Rhodothermales bacterium]